MIRPITPADRAAFLAKWADRYLSRLPVCPDCGRFIPPEIWDAHKQLCCSGPAAPADRASHAIRPTKEGTP